MYVLPCRAVDHFPYFYSVFWLCAPLCQSMSKFQTNLRAGTLCYSVYFHTRVLPFLTELYTLFYVHRVKVIPDILIMYDLLTPIALAHWIEGDGHFNVASGGL